VKTLLILRHGKSSWKHTNSSDHDRPLKNRGKQDAPRMGELIQNEGLTPDLIISSTAERAKETAILTADACGYEGEIIFTRDLYLADESDYLAALQALGSDSSIIMVVSHNPGSEMLVSMLTDENDWMPTAALAHIQLPIGQWEMLNAHTEGELINLWRPRELP